MGHALNIFIDAVVDDGKMANFEEQFWRILFFFFPLRRKLQFKVTNFSFRVCAESLNESLDNIFNMKNKNRHLIQGFPLIHNRFFSVYLQDFFLFSLGSLFSKSKFNFFY